MTAQEARSAIRRGEWRRPTAGLAPANAQANLVMLPREHAYDFLLFCQRNPRPCPLLGVTDPGAYEPACARGGDLRTDLPRYRLFRDGAIAAELDDLLSVFRDDLVSFLIGCSFSFEAALLDEGFEVRHLTEGRNVPMYRTCRSTVPSGPFGGPLVVSMRPFPPAQVASAMLEASTAVLPAPAADRGSLVDRRIICICLHFTRKSAYAGNVRQGPNTKR